MRIDRQIHVGAEPRRVASWLGSNPYGAALNIVPDGAGAKVLICAQIEPEALAKAVEVEMLQAVCLAKRQLENKTKTKTSNQRQRKTKMNSVSRSTVIDAPRAEVWRALADFGKIAEWNPAVKHSHLTSDQPGGLGATRHCDLAPMGEVEERITSWDEQRFIGIDLYETRKVPAMRSASANFELHDIGERTKVTVSMSYELGLGPIGASMNALGMRRRFEKVASQMMAGLKHHVETGEPVTGKTKLPIDDVTTAA